MQNKELEDALNRLKDGSLSYTRLFYSGSNALVGKKTKDEFTILEDYKIIKNALVENEELKARNEELIRISEHAYEKQKIAEQENKRLKARIEVVCGSLCFNDKTTETLKCNTPHFINIENHRINLDNVNYYYPDDDGKLYHSIDCNGRICASSKPTYSLTIMFEEKNLQFTTEDKNELNSWLKLLGEER